MSNSRQKTSVKPILLLLIFIVPMIMSWLLFHYHDHFQFKTTNHGILVNPPLNVGNIDFGMDTQKKWKIIFVSANNCDEQCQQIAFQLHQIQKAMGKDHERIIVVQWHGENTPFKDIFQQNFVTNKIFLVDPHNNLFMYYPSTTNPMNILKDIKKVLGVSQIG